MISVYFPLTFVPKILVLNVYILPLQFQWYNLCVAVRCLDSAVAEVIGVLVVLNNLG